MTEIVIRAENIGKKFKITQQSAGRYTNLRDVISRKIKSITRKITPPFKRNESSPSHEEFWALRDVSFEVKKGEVIGIIGRNGAGKTTLLKILSRITEPTTGKFNVKGRVASLLEVGTGFHPELTGRENIFLNGAILGMSRAEIKGKFDEIVDFAEIAKFLDTPVKRYSSGMYVRLAFAVAAHLEPEILIVDEVLAVGDIEFQKKCLGKMEEAGESGRTVLFVSHNITAIRTLCNRALLLNNGRIVSNGSVEETIKKYIDNIRKNIFSRKWVDENTAPQNESAVIKKIAICNENSEELEEIYTNTYFNIEIDYKIKTEGAFLGLTIVVYDNENNCVFSSINNQEVNWYGKPMSKGKYKSICHIPANFFNNGSFNITLNLFGKGYSDVLVLSEILTIEILDSAFLRRDYFGMWAGVVRPKLLWVTESIISI